MIEVEGRVLAGLDEFMLRVGHLLVFARVAHETGSSWRRIERETAQRLAAKVVVDANQNGDVAEYLMEKELCRRAPPLSSLAADKELRYPDLEVYELSSEVIRVRSLNTPYVQISWQDKNIADRRTRSRVGAITSTAKVGSKTGLSHVSDWVQLLELINRAGQVTPIGRLLVSLSGASAAPYELWNPYVLGFERIFVAYEYFRKDFDLFARFAPLLNEAKPPITKSVCRQLFVAALKAVVRDAGESKHVTSRGRYELNQQLKDLESAAKRSDCRADETSTAWHRAASRVETLTDCGLLEKGKAAEKEKYQYVYYPTDRLKLAIATLQTCSNAEQWIEVHLAEATIDTLDARQNLSEEDALSDLRSVVEALSLPTTLLPIDCLALGVVYLQALKGRLLSLHSARTALEDLAATHPDVARLARGRAGTRADFLSINIRRM